MAGLAGLAGLAEIGRLIAVSLLLSLPFARPGRTKQSVSCPREAGW
jgi:hypothetical protein